MFMEVVCRQLLCILLKYDTFVNIKGGDLPKCHGYVESKVRSSNSRLENSMSTENGRF